jgi:hypothetical protein
MVYCATYRALNWLQHTTTVSIMQQLIVGDKFIIVIIVIINIIIVTCLLQRYGEVCCPTSKSSHEKFWQQILQYLQLTLAL